MVWLVCLTLLMVPTAGWADAAAGALRGSVLDPDGRAVVDAALIIRNDTTGAVKTTVTDERGQFSVADLITGTYTVEVAVPGFDIVRRPNLVVGDGTTEVAIKLSVANISETVTVSAALPAAAAAAPSQGSLTASSAQSLISNEFIRNYTSPVSDYAQVLQMTPGTFNVAANGPGLGDTKTFFRGFKDGYYSMTYDGIPFGDTNDPTHHSWVFFPAQTIGSTVVDRSPGTAASVGPSTYGGSVNLISRGMLAQPLVAGTYSYGTWNTKLLDLEYSTGQFGADGRNRFLIEAHQMTSDGYQTYNDQKRNAFQAKYQYQAGDNTSLTAFSSVMQLTSNTPNQKGSTRAQIAQFGDNFLMTADPSSPLYYGYNFYNIPTNFEYVGFRTMLGNGWSIDAKGYTMRYHNQQNYNGLTTISATSATDKLNAYWKVGNLLPVSYVNEHGMFRTGLWSEYASTNRYQIPSDPRTWVDSAVPNFHEQFGTTTLQPYAEYEWRVAPTVTVTPGIKFAYYDQNFRQFADGKTVGSLSGQPYVDHGATYHDTLPSVNVHWLPQSFWSLYAQYARGDNIPPTSVYDVKGAQVSVAPKPITADTVQVGSVWKSRRATLDANYYHIHFDSDYSSTLDPVTGDTVYFLNGAAVTQGVEAESTLIVGGGLSVYLNGTKGAAKYTDSDLWVQNSPSATETIGITFNKMGWNLGFFSKRIAGIWQDNGAAHQAVEIDPFDITNLFLNYTFGRNAGHFSQSRIRFAVNNLTDNHAITGVTPASTKSNLPAPGDVLTLMAGRSVSIAFTVGFSTR
ncbi:MAG TPA: TonB-dependent receptor [Vicinamibacterales bacterium]|nr:TonB-dependent receptor [Vicinamibacterales bacterium]